MYLFGIAECQLKCVQAKCFSMEDRKKNDELKPKVTRHYCRSSLLSSVSNRECALKTRDECIAHLFAYKNVFHFRMRHIRCVNSSTTNTHTTKYEQRTFKFSKFSSRIQKIIFKDVSFSVIYIRIRW